MHCYTRMFFAIFIQIISEWLRSYSSCSPIPPMTQHSTSLLIFGTRSTSLLIFLTFILTHSFAICYFCPLLFLPIILTHSIAISFLLFSNQGDETTPPTAPCIATQVSANPVQCPFSQPWYHLPPIRCTPRAPPNKNNNAAYRLQCSADTDSIKHLHSTSTIDRLKHSALYPTIVHNINQIFKFCPLSPCWWVFISLTYALQSITMVVIPLIVIVSLHAIACFM